MIPAISSSSISLLSPHPIASKALALGNYKIFPLPNESTYDALRAINTLNNGKVTPCKVSIDANWDKLIKYTDNTGRVDMKFVGGPSENWDPFTYGFFAGYIDGKRIIIKTGSTLKFFHKDEVTWTYCSNDRRYIAISIREPNNATSYFYVDLNVGTENSYYAYQNIEQLPIEMNKILNSYRKKLFDVEFLASEYTYIIYNAKGLAIVDVRPGYERLYWAGPDNSELQPYIYKQTSETEKDEVSVSFELPDSTIEVKCLLNQNTIKLQDKFVDRVFYNDLLPYLETNTPAPSVDIDKKLLQQPTILHSFLCPAPIKTSHFSMKCKTLLSHLSQHLTPIHLPTRFIPYL